MKQVIVSIRPGQYMILHVLLPQGSGKHKDWMAVIRNTSISARVYRTIDGLLILVAPDDVENVTSALKRLSADRNLEVIQAEGVRVVEEGELLT